MTCVSARPVQASPNVDIWPVFGRNITVCDLNHIYLKLCFYIELKFYLPQATCETSEPINSEIFFGKGSSCVELCPSWPCVPDPNENTPPSSVITIECFSPHAAYVAFCCCRALTLLGHSRVSVSPSPNCPDLKQNIHSMI